jgi:phenylacetate-CoA ligase
MEPGLARGLYRLVDLVQGQDTFKALHELRRNESRSPAELQERCWRDVKAFTEFAGTRVPYYRQLFRRIGLLPTEMKNFDDFRKIPILDKGTLRTRIDDLEAEPGWPVKFSVARTSGSTGIPLVFRKDNRSFSYAQAAMYRGHGWHGVAMGEVEALLWGISTCKKKRLVMQLKDLLLNRFREREYNLSEAILEEFCLQCRERRPAYLVGYTTMVYQFARMLKRQGMDGRTLGFKFVKCTSENIYDYQRELIEEVFGCRLASEYGAAETGLIAFECPHGSHHLSIDCNYTEILDEQGEPVREGETGQVVVTDFCNFKTPLLRYAIGDLAVYSTETCSCGRTLPLVRKIVGRANDVAYSAAGKPFHSSVFNYIMKDFHCRDSQQSGIAQFRIHQRAMDKLQIQIVPVGEFGEGDKEILWKKIWEQMGDNMAIDLILCNQIERDPSGKFRNFISDIGV